MPILDKASDFLFLYLSMCDIMDLLPFLFLFADAFWLLSFLFLFCPVKSRVLYSDMIDATTEMLDSCFELKILPFLHFHMDQMVNNGMAHHSFFMEHQLLNVSVMDGKEHSKKPYWPTRFCQIGCTYGQVKKRCILFSELGVLSCFLKADGSRAPNNSLGVGLPCRVLPKM